MKPITVHFLLSLVIYSHWVLHQLDIQNAFLHGDLEDDVYMWQPPDFVHPNFLHHVCKLSKSIYGLKQAPRAWYGKLCCKILSLGFHCSKSITSLFIMQHNFDSLFILIYVDDIIVTGSNPLLISNIIDNLATDFSVKDLDSLHYFWVLKFINISLVCFCLRLSISLIYCTKLLCIILSQ